ncbi:MAG: tRNA (adenosine(37)-N6)-dimethylallyltransferase MiaA [Bacteroidetes bacterium]|nr:tRNA (adenosine(37)-N6)-dimethylallyltransferase MiaA [Bacteroidota bacterium]
MSGNRKYLIVIAGPTGIGKTNVSIQLAQLLNCEIFSADARQFYREMNIGTAKPTSKELATVKHHFVNNLSIMDKYSVGDFEREVIVALTDYYKKHEVAILVGGSGLFIKAVISGLDEFPEIDPEIRAKLNRMFQSEGIGVLQELLKEKDPDYYEVVDISNPRRLIRALELCLQTGKKFTSFLGGAERKRDFEVIYIGLKMDREMLYQRIDQRIDHMMENGLLDEAKNLKEHENRNAMQAVGYKELFGHLNGEMRLEEAVELIKRNSRRYAKRQFTWFNKIENMNWFDPQDVDLIIRYAKEKMSGAV